MEKGFGTSAVISIIALLVLLGGGFWYFNESQRSNTPFTGCTEEVILCPDGKTGVGRVPPTCEFAECPVSKAGDGILSSVDSSLVADDSNWTTYRDEVRNITFDYPGTHVDDADLPNGKGYYISLRGSQTVNYGRIDVYEKDSSTKLIDWYYNSQNRKYELFDPITTFVNGYKALDTFSQAYRLRRWIYLESEDGTQVARFLFDRRHLVDQEFIELTKDELPTILSQEKYQAFSEDEQRFLDSFRFL